MRVCGSLAANILAFEIRARDVNSIYFRIAIIGAKRRAREEITVLFGENAGGEKPIYARKIDGTIVARENHFQIQSSSRAVYMFVGFFSLRYFLHMMSFLLSRSIVEV